MDLNENWHIFAHRIILCAKISVLLDILPHHIFLYIMFSENKLYNLKRELEFFEYIFIMWYITLNISYKNYNVYNAINLEINFEGRINRKKFWRN